MDTTKFEDMRLWQDARKLTLMVYQVTAAKDFDEDVELRQRMRRAAVCVMTNAAELFETKTTGEVTWLRRAARRSVNQLQSHIYVALDRYYVEEDAFEKLSEAAGTLKESIATYGKQGGGHIST